MPELRQLLLAWWDVHGRHAIPWRLRPDGSRPADGEELAPYGVVVAEVMLQPDNISPLARPLSVQRPLADSDRRVSTGGQAADKPPGLPRQQEALREWLHRPRQRLPVETLYGLRVGWCKTNHRDVEQQAEARDPLVTRCRLGQSISFIACNAPRSWRRKARRSAS